MVVQFFILEIEKKKSKLNVLQKNNETLAEELREGIKLSLCKK